jgi:hypothetical protein
MLTPLLHRRTHEPDNPLHTRPSHQTELRKVRNLHERELKLLHGRLQRVQSFELEVEALKRELDTRTRELHNARKSARVHNVEVGVFFCPR